MSVADAHVPVLLELLPAQPVQLAEVVGEDLVLAESAHEFHGVAAIPFRARETRIVRLDLDVAPGRPSAPA